MNLPETYTVKKVKTPKDIQVRVPGSKSITNRALLIAALAKGKSRLKGVLFSDDSRHFLSALIDLGFSVEIDEKNGIVDVEGIGGKIPKAGATIHVGSAGTAARFLTAYLGLSAGEYEIQSSEQMKKRPMKELLVALEALGAKIKFHEEEYHFPFTISNPVITEASSKEVLETTVDVDKSSQFLSALLIVSVILDRDFVIHVTGSHGMAYVEMTIAMMKQFGVSVQRLDTNSFLIPADTAYEAREYQIEPDLSAACYFYAMSPVLGVSSMVKDVRFDCLQGDIAFLHVLEEMGCRIEEKDEGIMVLPPEQVLRGGSFDLSRFSDQALTLAALAPFAKDAVTILHVGHIRYQECDRMQAIVRNLQAMGIRTEASDDSITIFPGKLNNAQIETFDDHRVAMAFTICGLTGAGITILNPACCKKTFENYYSVLEEALY